MTPSSPAHPSTTPNFTFWYLNGIGSHERVGHTEHGRDPGIPVPPGGKDTNGLVQHIHSWGNMSTMVSPRHKEEKNLRGVPMPISGIQRDGKRIPGAGLRIRSGKDGISQVYRAMEKR